MTDSLAPLSPDRFAALTRLRQFAALATEGKGCLTAGVLADLRRVLETAEAASGFVGLYTNSNMAGVSGYAAWTRLKRSVAALEKGE